VALLSQTVPFGLHLAASPRRAGSPSLAGVQGGIVGVDERAVVPVRTRTPDAGLPRS
jgi:hypothetical protein